MWSQDENFEIGVPISRKDIALPLTLLILAALFALGMIVWITSEAKAEAKKHLVSGMMCNSRASIELSLKLMKDLDPIREMSFVAKLKAVMEVVNKEQVLCTFHANEQVGYFYPVLPVTKLFVENLVLYKKFKDERGKLYYFYEAEAKAMWFVKANIARQFIPPVKQYFFRPAPLDDQEVPLEQGA